MMTRIFLTLCVVFAILIGWFVRSQVEEPEDKVFATILFLWLIICCAAAIVCIWNLSL